MGVVMYGRDGNGACAAVTHPDVTQTHRRLTSKIEEREADQARARRALIGWRGSGGRRQARS